MTPDELHEELAAGRLRPAYLLAGEEVLLRDDALAALRDAVLDGAPPDFDLDRLEGDRATPAVLLDALRTLPVVAPRRLVWLREPGASRALLDALAACVAELGAGGEARVVLVVTARLADARTAWVRAFGEHGALVRCSPPRGSAALLAFVRREAKRQGVSLGPRAAEQLAERVGPQLLVLRNEIAKAALLAGEGRVGEAHVAAAVLDVAEEPIWDLTDAIGSGQAAEALAVLAKLLRAGAPPPVVLGALAAHLRKLLRLRAGGRVAGPPFVVRKLEAQARRYPLARLLGGLDAAAQTDEALKGRGGIPPGIALERLVLALAS